jgi:hypothetical protein
LVEHTAENRGVAGSIPALAITRRNPAALRADHDDFAGFLVSIRGVTDRAEQSPALGGGS